MNVSQTPNKNLRTFLNNARFTRLTPNNKKVFLGLLNRGGSNLNKIKRNAVELQRKRELNSYLNTKQLSDRQKNIIRSKISTTSLNNLVRMANNFGKGRSRV
jgi:glycerate-2-kinase